ILRALTANQVRFIVVGGVSAVLHGAPYTTFDLDIVHARDPENVERLLTTLKTLQAVYRFPPERRLEPNASHLSGPGHSLLATHPTSHRPTPRKVAVHRKGRTAPS